MQVGDQIQVQISGGETGVTLGDPNGASMTIGPDASMAVAGVIIADLGNRWRVQLNMSIAGQNIVEVQK